MQPSGSRTLQATMTSPDLALFPELNEPLRLCECRELCEKCDVPVPSRSCSPHSRPLSLLPLSCLEPAGVVACSSTAGSMTAFPTDVYSLLISGFILRLEAAELLRRDLVPCGPGVLLLGLTGGALDPGPILLSDRLAGGESDNFRFPEILDCVFVLAATCGWKTGTLARFAMSSHPICQCIDSTALQGRAISLAIMSHISFLNL